VARLALIRDLTKAAGHDGMIGGQMIDLSMDSLPATEDTITRLQDLKTGALIHYGVMAGATLAGADEAARAHLSAYAAHIGLIFQITDDLLDAEGDADTVGKAVQKDDEHGKATFVSILGIEMSQTPLLDTVNLPADIRDFSKDQLKQLADELRTEVIDAVSVTGGHLGAGLGVVELTVALHHVFNTPDDKLIWDVSHQCYPHKVLTGRRDRIRTLRQGGGLSGFTKRAESEYDDFGAAHSSTSISAGVGFATARDLKDDENHVVSVIGDGAITAGMAYEAMNNAGGMNSRMIVILNDNDMAEEYTRGMVTGGTLFEELGFYYVGPIDGHDMDALLPVLKNCRDMKEGPILIHVVTQKGKGYGRPDPCRQF